MPASLHLEGVSGYGVPTNLRFCDVEMKALPAECIKTWCNKGQGAPSTHSSRNTPMLLPNTAVLPACRHTGICPPGLSMPLRLFSQV